jgi:hypothetical protein
MTYSQIAWLPLTGGLTLLGLVLSWLAWRRRGAAAGLRGAAWSLLPLAAYLIGAIELLWRFGTAIGSFAASFVFSPEVWSGVAVVAVAVVLFTVSAFLRRRRAGRHPGPAAASAAGAGASRRAVAARPPGPGGDDDLSEVEQILRRRGIR